MIIKIKILKYVLALLTLLSAFFAWQSVERAINISGSGAWTVPTLWFSLLIMLLYVDILTIKRILMLQSMLAAVFLLSLFFASGFWYLIALALAYLFSSWALLKIKKDLRLNVKLSLWKSVRTGSTLLILAVSIVISSQYYFEIKNLGREHIVPHFQFSGLTSGLTSRILSAFNPNFKNMDQQGLTVDQFVLEIAKQQNAGALPNNGQEGMILEEGRKQLSEMVGTPLAGQEKVSDVFSNLINDKINQYLAGSGLSDSNNSSVLPYIMAIVLFITTLSLGSFLNTFWILVAELAFFVLVRLKFIKVSKVSVEMEVIE